MPPGTCKTRIVWLGDRRSGSSEPRCRGGCDVAVLLSTGIAAATPSWAIQTTPNGPGATTSVLSGVSCTSSSACVAVGYYVNGSSDDVVFAEAFTTTGWTILSPVIPTGASSSELSGVSCLSATSCTAVGSYNNGTNTVALIEQLGPAA